MGVVKKSRSVVLFLSLIFVISFFSLRFWYANVDADTYVYPVKILEITSSGTSDFSGVNLAKNLPNVSIETMSMKKFVALREDLDGKYDGIYIGSGAYSTAYPSTFSTANKSAQATAHNTANVMNDITHLKADEIVSKYIDKGLLVILHNDIWSQTSNSKKPSGDRRILYDTFVKYRTSRPENVLLLGKDEKVSSLITKLKNQQYSSLLRQRPRLEITTKPGNQIEFQAGQQLTFKFNVNNVSDLSNNNSLTANLYLNVDSVLPMGMDQLVTSVPVTTAGANTLIYTLPNGFSGPLYWRLEITNPLSTSKLKDYDTGSFFFKGEKTVIRVLQIMPDNNNSSLKNENRNYTNNMAQSYLSNSNYEIVIETKLSSNFNTATVYDNLNGKYDMLIFGFRDEYNQFAQMSKEAAQAVQKFIATGQSVMFTHDTVFNDGADNSNRYWGLWLEHFQEVTGQDQLMTNLGLGNPVSGTMTVPVNDGLLTQYPFLLTSRPSTGSVGQIASTHNQYFMLDLEDPTLVSWYNIQGGSRDTADSWNHYYTYSKGNVTYSGTGHTNTGFPEWEQKLFVNTMYRAFMGSNHKPSITVHSPADESEMAAHHPLVISYTVNDLDLQDYKLNTSVVLKYTENRREVTKTVLPQKSVYRGETITFSVDNPLPEGGELTIEIYASDKNGAPDTKIIHVTAEKVSANLLTERKLSANVVDNKVAKNSEVTIEYTMTPKPIPNSLGVKEDELVLSNISIQEVLPANLEIKSVSLPSLTYTGSLEQGYTLNGTFSNIRYRLSSDKKQYIADPVTFNVKIVPKKNGVYSLINSKVSFRDIGQSKLTELNFPPLVFEAITMIENLYLDDQTLLVGDQGKMTYRIEPEDASNKVLLWQSSNPSVVTVNDKGEIEGKTAGESTIMIKSTDGSKKEATAQVKVITPELSITGPSKVKVGETVTLKASLVTTGERVTEVSWSFKQSDHSAFADLKTTPDLWQRELTGKKSGSATVSVVVKTVSLLTNKERQYSKDYTVTIINPITKIEIEGPSSVKVRGTGDFVAVVTPEDADPQPFVWSFAGNEDNLYASLEPNGDKAKITGKQIGRVTVKVKAGEIEATRTIDIGPILTAIRLPSEITIVEGSTYSLLEDLKLYPATVELKEVVGDLTWSSSSSSNVTVVTNGNQGGFITAHKRGFAIIEVVYGPNPSIRTQITVKVTAKSNSNRY